MSLRASEEARPDFGHHHHHDAQPVVAEQRFLALLEGVATGCGPSEAFGGKIIPCGVICCRGKPSRQTLGNTYIVTSRTMADLNGDNQLHNGLDLVTVPALEVKSVLNTALQVEKYKNVYTYKVGLQGNTFDVEAEMRKMGVEDWTSQMTGHGLDEAFSKVHEVCALHYGQGNYTLRSFLKR